MVDTLNFQRKKIYQKHLIFYVQLVCPNGQCLAPCASLKHDDVLWFVCTLHLLYSVETQFNRPVKTRIELSWECVLSSSCEVLHKMFFRPVRPVESRMHLERSGDVQAVVNKPRPQSTSSGCKCPETHVERLECQQPIDWPP